MIDVGATNRNLRVVARKNVRKPDAAAAEVAPVDDDWYANIMRIDGRKCTHATHATTRFAISAPDVRADDLRPPGPLLAAKIAEQLESEGLPGVALGNLDGKRATIWRTASQ